MAQKSIANRRQLERLRNPLTGEIRLVSVHSREFNRLKKYGWLKASLGEWFQWLKIRRDHETDKVHR